MAYFSENELAQWLDRLSSDLVFRVYIKVSTIKISRLNFFDMDTTSRNAFACV